jgi:hypothetical protein
VDIRDVFRRIKRLEAALPDKPVPEDAEEKVPAVSRSSIVLAAILILVISFSIAFIA